MIIKTPDPNMTLTQAISRWEGFKRVDRLIRILPALKDLRIIRLKELNK